MNIDPEIAVWALTPGGLKIARKIVGQMPHAVLMLSESIYDYTDAVCFQRLGPAVNQYFHQFQGHVFVMATGIVVRMIAGHLQHKTTDPGVVVVDDKGQFAISLVSGHLGGANALARAVATVTEGVPVITTATDVNHLPAIDTIAQTRNLVIENPDMIKAVNMAFLKSRKVVVYDPYNLINGMIPEEFVETQQRPKNDMAMIVVDDRIAGCRDNTLYLRPGVLSAGIGCNRGTSCEEIRQHLVDTCTANSLSLLSVQNLATIDIKKNEAGIRSLGNELGIPILFYNSLTLDQVGSIKNPSDYAKKYTGAKSVCEAAAIMASNNGTLIVPKTKTKNVTIALARR